MFMWALTSHMWPMVSVFGLRCICVFSYSMLDYSIVDITCKLSDAGGCAFIVCQRPAPQCRDSV